MDMARSAVGPFSMVVTRKLTESIDALQALQSGEAAATKPIAAVKGWFHGECIIQALDPEAVLPAGMALYAAPQPAPEGYVLVPVKATRKIEDAIAMSRNLKAAEIWEDALSAALLSAGKENNNAV
jgi:hypothetical protein